MHGAAAVSIRSSLDLAAEDVAALERELVGERNRFVCLQLVTMLREQVARNRTAAATGDQEWLRQAEVTFLATVAEGGRVLGAAIFYPRLAKPKSKNDEVAAVIEGLAAGPGALSRTASRAISLSVRAGPPSGGLAGDAPLQLGPQGASGESAAAAAAAAVVVAAAVTALPESALPEATPPISPAGPPPAGCCSEITAAAAGSHVYIELICVNAPGRGFGSLLLAHVEQFVAANAQQLSQRHGPIAGLRLLSVSSAMGFYRAQGYGEPDEGHESFKPLGAVVWHDGRHS